MARQMRIDYPGAVYHVTSRGNARQDVYLEPEDRLLFLDILEQVNRRYNWICHAFCLMDNHYHLLIETPDGNLSQGMRQLGGVYTQSSNRRHSRVGHLFQGRYKAVLVQKETHLLEAVRYVVLNPVRAGMVADVSEWPWSSFLATVGRVETNPCLTVSWILRQFSDDTVRARSLYRKFVLDGVEHDGLWDELKGQTLLGTEGFSEQIGAKLGGLNDVDEIPRNERLINRPKIEGLFDVSTMSDKLSRNSKLVEAVEKFGYTQKELADHLGLHYSTISRLIKSSMSKVKT